MRDTAVSWNSHSFFNSLLAQDTAAHRTVPHSTHWRGIDLRYLAIARLSAELFGGDSSWCPSLLIGTLTFSDLAVAFNTVFDRALTNNRQLTTISHSNNDSNWWSTGNSPIAVTTRYNGYLKPPNLNYRLILKISTIHTHEDLRKTSLPICWVANG